MAINKVERHTVWIMERGGKKRIEQLTNIESVEWTRVRDDMSQAIIKVGANVNSEQAKFLASLAGAVGRYELCIWRGTERVWEGPLSLVTFRKEGVEIMARDVMLYTARTIMRAKYDNSFPNTIFAVQRAKNVLTAELARKEALNPPINVVPHIRDFQTPTDAKNSRVTLPYQMTVFDHVDDLAAKGGMDYTVLGRSILLWDTSKPALGTTATITEKDFLGELYVSVYGMELGTIAAVTDGQGGFGVAGAVDSYYGEWERLESPYDEEATASPTKAELVSQAQRNLAGRNPVPLQVRIPDGSSLNMDGTLKMADLVPGVYIPLRATINLVEISQMQKLQVIKVIETSAGEDVQVTLYPASDPDEVEEE